MWIAERADMLFSISGAVCSQLPQIVRAPVRSYLPIEFRAADIQFQDRLLVVAGYLASRRTGADTDNCIGAVADI